MILEFRTQYSHIENYMLIEAEFLEEFDEKRLKSDGDIEMPDMEQMMAELRNLGSNQRSTTLQNIESMSLEEIRRQYEEQILREKYGDDYERRMEQTYRDFLNERESEKGTSSSDQPSNQTSYSGPALVFVELDNEERGHSYIHVPVFTCRDGGVVVIDITIGSDGRVSRTSVASVTGSGDTSCIVNEARTAASQSRFSPIAGGRTEGGKITYHFIQQ